MARPRTVAIIQARSGSVRFPRKVMADLAGRPLIWHLIHRISQCREVDETVVATSDRPGDDDLAGYVSGLGVRVVRGSEENVLSRLLEAARVSEAGIIVRVTGDAPLVDPLSLDAQVAGMREASADFCISPPEQRNINEGFEAFTREALEALDREAGDDPVAREHTCTYFKQHPDFVKTVYVPVPEALQFEGARVSVDTPADLEFLERLHERLGAAPGEIDMRDVVRLLRREPDLARINAGVIQKRPGAVSRQVVIRCDASPEIGLGHLVRCLALADVLRDESFGVTLVSRPSEVASEMIDRHRHRHVVLDESKDRWVQLEELLGEVTPDALVLDVRDGVEREVVEGIRERSGVLIIDIDDPEDKRLACDLVFYPPVPQLERLTWNGFSGEIFSGWEWLLLRPQFHKAHEARLSRQTSPEDRPTILITMGGSDPAGMTLKAARALGKVEAEFRAVFVIGNAFCHEEAFQRLIEPAQYPVEILRSVENMGELMLGADLALACFSMTAYELATAGVPSIFLCLTDDHAESSAAFSEAGMGLSLGHHETVGDSRLAEAVDALLRDPSRRFAITEAALSRTDGLGARRIAGKISEVLNHRS